jgi:hypothetical protein
MGAATGGVPASDIESIGAGVGVGVGPALALLLPLLINSINLSCDAAIVFSYSITRKIKPFYQFVKWGIYFYSLPHGRFIW